MTAAKPSCTCGEGTATLHWSNCALYTSQLLGARQARKEKQVNTATKPTGVCPICERPYQLKTDGTLRSHWKRDGMGKGLPFSDPCTGAGQPPKEQP